MSQKQTPQPNMSNIIRRRLLVLVALLVLVGFGSVIANLIKLQIVEYEDYKVRAANQQLKDVVIPANRGVIYDSNMKVLRRAQRSGPSRSTPAPSTRRIGNRSRRGCPRSSRSTSRPSSISWPRPTAPTSRSSSRWKNRSRMRCGSLRLRGTTVTALTASV